MPLRHGRHHTWLYEDDWTLLRLADHELLELRLLEGGAWARFVPSDRLVGT